MDRYAVPLLYKSLDETRRELMKYHEEMGEKSAKHIWPGPIVLDTPDQCLRHRTAYPGDMPVEHPYKCSYVSTISDFMSPHGMQVPCTCEKNLEAGPVVIPLSCARVVLALAETEGLISVPYAVLALDGSREITVKSLVKSLRLIYKQRHLAMSHILASHGADLNYMEASWFLESLPERDSMLGLKYNEEYDTYVVLIARA